MRTTTLMLLAIALAALTAAPARPAPARAAAAASRKAAARQVLPWIQDDYTRAVALAKARQVPLFIDAWAPW